MGGREKCQKCLDRVTPDVGSAARRLFNSPAALSPSFERRPLARSLAPPGGFLGAALGVLSHLARGGLLILVKVPVAHPHVCTHTHRHRFAPKHPAQDQKNF